MKAALTHYRAQSKSAFTMVEIAISLAVIGFALVAIIGILPAGLTVQRENREETIINQDANYLMEAIRGGGRSSNELAKYFDSIAVSNEINRASSVWDANFFNERNEAVVGLLSTRTHLVATAQGLLATNLILARVRAISGSAVEKPPQDDTGVRDLAFSYRLISKIVPFSGFDTNATNWFITGPASPQYTNWLIARTMQTNLYEVSLKFEWPLLPNGSTGPGRKTYRFTVGSPLNLTNPPAPPIPIPNLYFFEPRSYATAR